MKSNEHTPPQVFLHLAEKQKIEIDLPHCREDQKALAAKGRYRMRSVNLNRHISLT